MISPKRERLKLLLDAQTFVQSKENVQYVHAGVKCNVKRKFNFL